MFKAPFRFVGKLALLIAAMAFLTLVGIFAFGSFVLTLPLHRMSPRDRRIKASMDLVQSGMAWLTAFSDNSLRKMMAEAVEPTDDSDPDVIYPYDDGDTLVLGPEVFVANDGSFLCWRGVNFVPQDLIAAATKVETTQAEQTTDAPSDSQV